MRSQINPEDILNGMKKEVDEEEFTKYLSCLSIDDDSNDDSIIFNAPNLIIANRIKLKHLKKMEEILKKKSSHMTIKIDIKKSKNKKLLIKKVFTNNQVLINESFLFENFIVGDCNLVAFRISQAIAKECGVLYNPVLIHGGSGLGKTHLLHSIANYIINNNPILRVIYVTSEMFLNDYVKKLGDKTIASFRKKYRSCDYLLIDDIQLFSGKDGIQGEFFNTFNELIAQKKQIVMTSDRPPKSMIGLTDRLKSRFEGGMLCGINPPTVNTKVDIIRKKCVINKVVVNEEIINLLAINIQDNIRQAEGILTKLGALSRILKTEITIDMAKEALQDIKGKDKKLSTSDILDGVANIFNLKISDLKSKKRAKNILKAKQIAIFIIKNVTKNGITEIAREFNIKHNSSISRQLTKISQKMQDDNKFKIEVEEIAEKIKNSIIRD